VNDCYCDVLSAEAKAELGVAEGFCGRCEVCGAPGHTRHAPGAQPYTGSWCDAHWPGLSARGEALVAWAVRLAVAGAVVWWIVG
jgi:hypothetical protein